MGDPDVLGEGAAQQEAIAACILPHGPRSPVTGAVSVTTSS